MVHALYSQCDIGVQGKKGIRKIESETGIVSVGEKAGSQIIIRLSRLLGKGPMGKPVANPKGPPIIFLAFPVKDN